MDTHDNRPAAAAGATIEALAQMIEAGDGILGLASDLSHLLHFLERNLEHTFDPARGRWKNNSGVDYTFNPKHVAATEWLASHTASLAWNLREKIEAMQDALDAARSDGFGADQAVAS